jgi:hypothetical protein
VPSPLTVTGDIFSISVGLDDVGGSLGDVLGGLVLISLFMMTRKRWAKLAIFTHHNFSPSSWKEWERVGSPSWGGD